MKYIETKKDIFTMTTEDYSIVHCISADFAFGAGIAKKIDNMFNIKQKLNKNLPNFINELWAHKNKDGVCVMTYINTKYPIFHLVTKTRYWNKPSYEAIRDSLESLKSILSILEINKIAMPKIGCGLDGLKWYKVSEIIRDVFKETDIEIVVCYLS